MATDNPLAVLDPDRIDDASRLIEQYGDAGMTEWWWHFLKAVVPSHSSSRAEQRERRNEHLRAAYATMQRASVRGFQDRINRFAIDTWPNVKSFQRAPESLTAIERGLFAAFATGEPVPTSIGQIHAIVSIVFGNPTE